ncbi:outer membrane protein transport protein [Candidatus Sulfidibacterium hydrothermale]|uniref:OmpP1/FadL family transporter n=1 Tax=Candidatus Sulfidibacterium hydrothermale TaxID=2875962 RepID=UPI001F0A7CB3|nr:outer membrane protein transport protein [Candidatus Sulfidibacterium hydrothermale]UBM62064.1 outer membrane protein transport protein [Candidatus Sulfidibacterium hydrothermale]
MKKLFITITLSFFVSFLFAQTADDALRISQNFYESTARSTAMGGAFGALGADLSVASTNPAGLGLFRTSIYSISPEINIRNVSSIYNGVSSSDNKTIFNLSNLGYTGVIDLGNRNQKGWKYMQFSFGMNRLNNFNTTRDMQGPNLKNSRLDVYVENADGINYQDIENDNNNQYSFDLNPAWQLYLIDTIPGYQNLYYNPVPYAGTYQREVIQQRGSINEWFFSFSANYNNVLYLGATIGLDALRYYSTSYYSERDIADTIPYFKSWEFDQYVETHGCGLNIKLGVIVQPIKWIRIGFAYHSPTWYWNLQDTWYTTTYADLEWNSPSSVSSPTGNYQYDFTTPMKFLADVGILISDKGSISFEYEHLNYSNGKFNSSSYDYVSENSDIKSYYKATDNFRIGTEWRLGLADVRAGYAYYGNPYARNLNDGSRQFYSAGVGFHFGNFVLDMAYVYSKMDKDYYLYGTSDISVAPVQNSYQNHSVILTFSYRL